MCEGGSVMRKDRQHFGSIFESIPPKVGRHNMLFIAVDAPALSSLSVQCTHTAEVCFLSKFLRFPGPVTLYGLLRLLATPSTSPLLPLVDDAAPKPSRRMMCGR